MMIVLFPRTSVRGVFFRRLKSTVICLFYFRGLQSAGKAHGLMFSMRMNMMRHHTPHTKGGKRVYINRGHLAVFRNQSYTIEVFE